MQKGLSLYLLFTLVIVNGIFAQECISPAEYQCIEKRCKENCKLLGLDKIVAKPQAVQSLSWPLRATQNLLDCSYYHISAYVDHNAAVNSYQDYNCGLNSYDGHGGTDISIWPFNFYKMDNDLVEVVAAANGTIIDKHEGEFDKNCSANNLTANYIIIQQSDGSRCMYWHLKKNSVTSKLIGQTVTTGEYLGVVGSSGSSTGPHLHFEVWNGSTSASRIDPYAGSCNTWNTTSWWITQKPYKETAVVKATVHNTDIVIPPCPATETLNQSAVYQIPFQGPGLAPGYAKFYLFLRDEVNGLVADLKIIKPDNTVYLSWTYTSTTDSKTKIWGWSKLLPTEPGTYTFQATYNNTFCSSTFDIVYPSSIIDVAPKDELVIFPNPTHGLVHLSNLKLNDVSFKLYDTEGRKVYSCDIKSGENVIDTKLSAGLYYYKLIKNDQSTMWGRLLVE